MTIDVYTPWREPIAAVKQRHVGREEVNARIVHAARLHTKGDKPIHLYLFGPRGSGKSHLLALNRPEIERLAAAAGRRVLSILEDVPILKTCDEVRRRLLNSGNESSWVDWGKPETTDASLLNGSVLLFEGLDRQLAKMNTQEQRALRKLISETQSWVIATGVSLTPALTKQDAAFYNFFSPWPIEALTDEESGTLLDVLVGKEVWKHDHWDVRRQALVGLSGGSPRTLVALAESCLAQPEAWASDHLHTVVQHFTAHYQMRFRDLSPTGQQVVELISRSPREISPGEAAVSLRADPRSIAIEMRRLVEDGVLLARREGRHTWYSVAEPLFRYWYEYRAASWDKTRVGWLARLIEQVMTPEEISTAWLDNPDPQMKGPFEEVLGRNEDAARHAWFELLERMVTTPTNDATKTMESLRRRAESLDVPDHLLEFTCSVFLGGHIATDWWRQRCAGQLHASFCAALELYAELESSTSQPKRAFVRFLREAARSPSTSESTAICTQRVFDAALDQLKRASPRGRSWVLSPTERRNLVTIPGVRATLLTRGKRRSHAPLLEPEDLLPLGPVVPDAAPLTVAAQIRRHPALFTQALALSKNLRPNPSPSTPVPAAHDLLTRRSAKALELLGLGWSWAASWAHAGPESFHDVLDATARLTDDLGFPDTYVAALISFGVLAPDRLSELIGVTSLPRLRAQLKEAQAVAGQLRQGGTARLHPELQALLDLNRQASSMRNPA